MFQQFKNIQDHQPKTKPYQHTGDIPILSHYFCHVDVSEMHEDWLYTRRIGLP